MRSSVIPSARMFTMVTMTLMAPRIEEAPIKWIEKISIGKDAPVCSTSGGDKGPPPPGGPPGPNKGGSNSREPDSQRPKKKDVGGGGGPSPAPPPLAEH